MKTTTQPSAPLARSTSSLHTLSAQPPAKSDSGHLRVRSSLRAGTLSVVADANDPDINHRRLPTSGTR